jgi:beta-hydroxylase
MLNKIKRELLHRAFQSVEKLIYKYSLVGDHAFFNKSDFPWVVELEKNWKAIKEELQEVLQHKINIPNFQDISPHQIALTKDDKWKTFFLYGYGFKSSKNCEKCPNTTKLVEKIPGMKTAFFSILEPHKHIPPHRGVYNGVLRYHLGLIIPKPEDSCLIRVDGEIRAWGEGESLVFDDSYEHQVWNDTDGLRVVLFVDFVRPLPFLINALNKLVIQLFMRSSLIKIAKENQDKYENEFHKSTTY